MFTQQALTILIFLLPGFLCMALLDMLTPGRKRLNLQYVVNALMFSLIIYAIYTLIFREFPVILAEKMVDKEKQYSIHLLHTSIVFLVLISLLVPMILSVCVKYDLHMRFFRKLKITDRTARSSLWFDIFTDIKDYVIVSFTDGKRLWGWPEYFSDDPEDKSLFVSQAAWIDDENNLIDLGVRGVLFPSIENIETIIFSKERTKDE